MGNLYEKFFKRVLSLAIHSTLGIEKARDQIVPLHSQDSTRRGEMLKLIVESRNQWKDQVLHEWDLEGFPSLHLSSCYGSVSELWVF
jgi:hypothetical protein